MDKKNYDELNDKIRVNQDILKINGEQVYQFTLYPSDYVIKHLGYIKSFDALFVEVYFNPVEHGKLVDASLNIKGKVEVYAFDSTETHFEDLDNWIDVVLSNDPEESDVELNEDGSFDILALALCVLYDSDYSIYSNDEEIYSELDVEKIDE